MKPSYKWAIFFPDGEMVPDTIQDTKKDCTREFSNRTKSTWETLQNNLYQVKVVQSTDPDVSEITASLIDQLKSRDAKGLAKYGVSLDRGDLTIDQWIDHAIEEALDFAGYLKALKRELKKGTKS